MARWKKPRAINGNDPAHPSPGDNNSDLMQPPDGAVKSTRMSNYSITFRRVQIVTNVTIWVTTPPEPNAEVLVRVRVSLTNGRKKVGVQYAYYHYRPNADRLEWTHSATSDQVCRKAANWHDVLPAVRK